MISKGHAALLGGFLFGAVSLLRLDAAWQKTDTTLMWETAGKPVWQFSFDPAKGKPFFHPVTVGGGPSLTNFRPEDHPWHYALWFSWKYINGTNYWEENRQTGKSGGKTSWSDPQIETHADGSATIKLDVSYTHSSGRVDMREARVLQVSAPAADGSYTIDWSADFIAGPEGAELGRTPMPGEPNGQHNGGYAGLSARLAHPPVAVTYVTTENVISEFTSNRARPNSPAVGVNFTEGDKTVGALAILSAPQNIAEKAPWYLIKSAEMHFVCAAILAPEVRKLPAGGTWNLRYRIVVQPATWTPESLRATQAAWR